MKMKVWYAKKKANQRSLPMDYQASLGTFDVIFGLSYKVGKFNVFAALQLPFSQNDNQFNPLLYPTSSPLSKFQNTNKFKRSSDIMARFSYNFKLTDKLNFIPNILSIYHLANDRYTDIFNREQDIKGSKGLTLGTNLLLDYALNSTKNLQLNFASPLVFREKRPDGTTRSAMVNVEYNVRF